MNLGTKIAIGAAVIVGLYLAYNKWGKPSDTTVVTTRPAAKA